MNESEAPLSSVRVVNLGLHIAGPLTALLLEGAGAETVHVLPPEHLLPASQLPVLVRGKRILRLDLKTEEGRVRLHGLLSQSDILIEGFRPGVMRRLGGALDELRDRFPHLITCSIPGFASNDPRAGMPGWEGAILAASGALRPVIADVQASASDAEPRFPATPIASNFAALIAAVSIVAALIERQRSGCGQGIEISLFDAMFEAIGDVGTWINGAGPGRNPRDRFGGSTYRCSDGRWVQFNTQNPDFLVSLCERAGLFAGNLPDMARLASDSAYRAALKERLQVEFSSRPAERWERIGLDSHIALIACRTLSEWRESERARQAEMVSGPEGCCLRSPGVRFTRRRKVAEPLHQPISRPNQVAAGPLEHLRVVDVSHYLAGPTAARVLAQLGADVCKLIEPDLRNLHKHDYVNRGKRSILCDLSHESGQAILRGLLRRADVFVHNFLPPSQLKLQVRCEDIHRLNPEVVYAAVSAYGEQGELSGRPGYETQGQAVSGMMLLGGAQTPVLHPFPVNDYGTGLATAFGIVCSLFAASENRTVYDVEGSLARTATMFQACISSPAGPAATWFDRSAYLQLAMKALDRWICIAGSGPEICEILELTPSATGEWPVERIAEKIACCDYSYWQTNFSGTRVSVVAVTELVDVMQDADLRRRGLVSYIENEELGTLTVPEPGVRFSRSAILLGAPHTRPGSHAAEIRALGAESPNAR